MEDREKRQKVGTSVTVLTLLKPNPGLFSYRNHKLLSFIDSID